MDTYFNLGPQKLALTNVEFDEIDQILLQMELENSLASPRTADLVDIAPFNSPEDMFIEDMAFQPSTSLSQSFLDSPLAPSLTTSSISESPLMLDYDSDLPSDFSPNNDGPWAILPSIMDFPATIPFDWSTPSQSWPDSQVSHDVCGVTWDKHLHGDDHPPHKMQPSSALATTQITDVAMTALAAVSPPAITSASTPALESRPVKHTLTCSYCNASFVDKTKLKIHTNKHTKPFRCYAAECGYANAEKKSLHRHLLAKSKWDEDHRLAADTYGVKETKHRCPQQGCTYSTIREDNLRRHIISCTT